MGRLNHFPFTGKKNIFSRKGDFCYKNMNKL